MAEFGGPIGALVVLGLMFAISCGVLAVFAYIAERRASRFEAQGRARVGLSEVNEPAADERPGSRRARR